MSVSDWVRYKAPPAKSLRKITCSPPASRVHSLTSRRSEFSTAKPRFGRWSARVLDDDAKHVNTEWRLCPFQLRLKFFRVVEALLHRSSMEVAVIVGSMSAAMVSSAPKPWKVRGTL